MKLSVLLPAALLAISSAGLAQGKPGTQTHGLVVDSPMPGFVVALCFASGILLVVLGVPLWLRRIPPNLFYGVRFRSALADDAVWYELNALAGRNLVAIGGGYLVLLVLGMTLWHTWTSPFGILLPTVILVIALVINTFVLHAAGRQLRATALRKRDHDRTTTSG